MRRVARLPAALSLVVAGCGTLLDTSDERTPDSPSEIDAGPLDATSEDAPSQGAEAGVTPPACAGIREPFGPTRQLEWLAATAGGGEQVAEPSSPDGWAARFKATADTLPSISHRAATLDCIRRLTFRMRATLTDNVLSVTALRLRVGNRLAVLFLGPKSIRVTAGASGGGPVESDATASAIDLATYHTIRLDFEKRQVSVGDGAQVGSLAFDPVATDPLVLEVGFLGVSLGTGLGTTPLDIHVDDVVLD